jgi:hypothetical protein
MDNSTDSYRRQGPMCYKAADLAATNTRFPCLVKVELNSEPNNPTVRYTGTETLRDAHGVCAGKATFPKLTSDEENSKVHHTLWQ